MNNVEIYTENGFELFSLDIKREIVEVRKKILSLFDMIAVAHDAGRVRNDEEMIELYSGPNKVLWRAVHDHLPDIPQISSLANHPAILKVANTCGIREPASTNGKPVILINVPGERGREFPNHQDFPFDPGGSENSLAIWIPLQDITMEIGPVELIPGSHKYGILSHGDNVDVKKVKLELPDGVGNFQPATAKVGQALALSSFTVHKSGQNDTKKGVKMSLHFRYRDLASPEYLSRKLPRTPVSLDDNLQFSLNS